MHYINLSLELILEMRRGTLMYVVVREICLDLAFQMHLQSSNWCQGEIKQHLQMLYPYKLGLSPSTD